MSNTDGEAQQTERCQYELWVNEYFGLPENFPEKATRMDFDYGNLVNMLAMFDVKRNKHHKQNLNDCMNEQDLELASLREQLVKLTNECEHHAKRQYHLENYYNEQLKQQEEVIRELIPIAEEYRTNLVFGPFRKDKREKTTGIKAIIEKAKSLTTKDKWNQ